MPIHNDMDVFYKRHVNQRSQMLTVYIALISSAYNSTQAIEIMIAITFREEGGSEDQGEGVKGAV